MELYVGSLLEDNRTIRPSPLPHSTIIPFPTPLLLPLGPEYSFVDSVAWQHVQIHLMNYWHLPDSFISHLPPSFHPGK